MKIFVFSEKFLIKVSTFNQENNNKNFVFFKIQKSFLQPKMNKKLLIGVAGGSGSGKTSICHKIEEQSKQLNVKCVILSADNWYHSHNKNFDCPEAYDWDELSQAIKLLKNGKKATAPVYDYKTHARTKERREIPDADCYILEGILVLSNTSVVEELDYKIFVDTPCELRLSRRIRRDLQERGRTDVIEILDQHDNMVVPGYNNYIAPTKNKADIIIPNGKKDINDPAINLVANFIHNHINAV